MKIIRSPLILISLFLTLGVILLGAYTRLMDAGLGCPDWPGCYGLWRAPTNDIKAHIEMVHRYFASTLGLLILMIAALTLFRSSTSIKTNQKILALSLVGLVIFQGLLGMWTVTLKLLPIVVMAHLLGGLLLLSLLFCLWIMQSDRSLSPIMISPATRYLALATLIMVCVQIALGGWTSTNYAALSCPDFPLCQNQFWPKMSWQAFNLIGASYLENPLSYMTLEARTAIHMAHRVGALITSFLIMALSAALWHHKKIILPILGLLILQISLGITNVLALLPLNIALAHNGIATLLLLLLIHLQFKIKCPGKII